MCVCLCLLRVCSLEQVWRNEGAAGGFVVCVCVCVCVSVCVLRVAQFGACLGD